MTVDVTYMIPLSLEATYEWAYLTVSDEDGATPIDPPEPPVDGIPPVEEPSDAPASSDPSGTSATASSTPAATPVMGQPSFTG
jgi:hypothetical protein